MVHFAALSNINCKDNYVIAFWRGDEQAAIKLMKLTTKCLFAVHQKRLFDLIVIASGTSVAPAEPII